MTETRETWLVAAWPGMGAVAFLAAEYLARKLGADFLADVATKEHFNPAAVVVKDGLLQPVHSPKTVLWSTKGKNGANSVRELVILLAEQQPATASWSYCEAVLARAREAGVTRAFTFAAMATTSSPRNPAQVFTAATDAEVLGEIQRLGVEPIRAGEIGGLNGMFLSVAAAQGIPGVCLLGEIPFFAGAVSNPKAAAAVLRVFARLAGLELNLEELDRAGAEIEQQLAAHHQKLEEAARSVHDEAARRSSEEEPESWIAPEGSDELSPRDGARIEALFQAAQADRSKALQLKAELDRLDVFSRFEDRFLDLFKRGG